MSRQACIDVDGSTRTVAVFRSWAVPEPLMKELLDFLIARLGMPPSEILSHQIEPRVEQVERCAERVGDG